MEEQKNSDTYYAYVSKNILGVYKCEANQKQQLSNYPVHACTYDTKV